MFKSVLRIAPFFIVAVLISVIWGDKINDSLGPIWGPLSYIGPIFIIMMSYVIIMYKRK